MRTKIVAGNWKMNLNRDESIQLVNDISAELQNFDLRGNRVIVFPPFINIPVAQQAVHRDPRLEVGAQNMHQSTSGAFTGEVSATMLLSHGVHTVILGHSERREYCNETDAMLKEKVDAAIDHGMEVVFCFGEKLEERRSDSHFQVVEGQLKNAIFHLNEADWAKIILAYEPVWAIGTGMTASPEQAQEMHAFIRGTISSAYTQEMADRVPILYGGSVKPGNAVEIFSKPDVDGGLIGGAALQANDFGTIVKSL